MTKKIIIPILPLLTYTVFSIDNYDLQFYEKILCGTIDGRNTSDEIVYRLTDVVGERGNTFGYGNNTYRILEEGKREYFVMDKIESDGTYNFFENHLELQEIRLISQAEDHNTTPEQTTLSDNLSSQKRTIDGFTWDTLGDILYNFGIDLKIMFVETNLYQYLNPIVSFIKTIPSYFQIFAELPIFGIIMGLIGLAVLFMILKF